MKLLVISGGGAHPYDESTPALTNILKEAGHQVEVTEDAGALLSSGIGEYDALVLNTSRYEDTALTKDEQAALEQYVGGGHGLVSIHLSGLRADDWPEYHEITGGEWVKSVSYHPPFGRFTVNVTNAAHPCAQGIGDFVTDDETYSKLTTKPSNDVFLTADSEGETHPMGWTRSYKKGRVFSTPLGHNGVAFKTPELQRLILNGVTWVTAKD